MPHEQESAASVPPHGRRPAEGHEDPTVTGATSAHSSPSGGDHHTLPLGAVFGHYTIESVLGAGGMGVVYRARQERPAREVALKVIRPGFASAQALRRFELEAEVLGRLQHPGIAQVYEAGTAGAGSGSGGQPFFAMELVRGEPLTRYADSKQLTTRQRLELFAGVCGAVQHAHTKGVIHRDLKPANILVDATGQPKILDFGVARLTQHDVQAATIQTDIGQLIGTVPYMSPEQVAGDPAQLDTRSDVYALGVILYELLTGRMPYDLSKKLIHEAARIIREDEPTRLSSINRTLRGDIETIALKALEKDKSRRYQAASDLGGDITRFLRSEPIVARPASRGYQLRKFAQRNKALVGGVAAAFVLLLAGLAGTSYGLVRAEEQRKAADANAAAETRARTRAEAINSFVTEALQSSDPQAGGRQGTTIAEAMASAVTRLDAGSFKNDPETEARLRDTIATIMSNNGRVSEAEPQLVKALATRRALFNGNHPDVAQSLSNLGNAMRELGRADEALPFLEGALEIYRRLFADDHETLAIGMNNLAIDLQALSRHEDAEPLFRQSLDMRRRLFVGDHADVALALNNLAFLLHATGRASEAEPLFVEALEMNRRLHPGAHPDVARGLANLASVRVALGRLAEAEPMFIEALEQYRRLFRGDHPAVATSLNNVAFVRQELGRLDEARALFSESLEMRTRLFGEDHPDVVQSLDNLASVMQELGRLEQAEALYNRALEMSRRMYPGDHVFVAQELNNLAAVRQLLGRHAECEALIVESLAMHRRMLNGDHPSVAAVLSNLARCHQALGRMTEGREEFDAAIAMLRRLSPDGSPLLARVLWRSGNARMESSNRSAAIAELNEAVEIAQRLLPGDHPQLKEYRETLAQCREAIGR